MLSGGGGGGGGGCYQGSTINVKQHATQRITQRVNTVVCPGGGLRGRQPAACRSIRSGHTKASRRASRGRTHGPSPQPTGSLPRSRTTPPRTASSVGQRTTLPATPSRSGKASPAVKPRCRCLNRSPVAQAQAPVASGVTGPAGRPGTCGGGGGGGGGVGQPGRGDGGGGCYQGSTINITDEHSRRVLRIVHVVVCLRDRRGSGLPRPCGVPRASGSATHTSTTRRGSLLVSAGGRGGTAGTMTGVASPGNVQMTSTPVPGAGADGCGGGGGGGGGLVSGGGGGGGGGCLSGLTIDVGRVTSTRTIQTVDSLIRCATTRRCAILLSPAKRLPAVPVPRPADPPHTPFTGPAPPAGPQSSPSSMGTTPVRGPVAEAVGGCERPLPLTGASARAIIGALARFLVLNGIVLGRHDLLAVDVLARSGGQMMVVVTVRQGATQDVVSYRIRLQRRHGHWQVSALELQPAAQISCL